MRHLSALLAALALAGCATGPTSSTTADDGYPPARFQGDAVNTVHYTSRPLNSTPCGAAAAGYQIDGCRQGGTNNVWLPNPCSSEFAGQSFARWACHEKGHSLGWPANHPRP